MPCGLAGPSAFPAPSAVVRCCHNSDMLCDGIPWDCQLLCVSPTPLFWCRFETCRHGTGRRAVWAIYRLPIARVRTHTTNRPKEGGTTRGRRVWRAISEMGSTFARQTPVSAGEKSGLRHIQCRRRRLCVRLPVLEPWLGHAYRVSHTIEALRLRRPVIA
jgi:hypothetical protein